MHLHNLLSKSHQHATVEPGEGRPFWIWEGCESWSSWAWNGCQVHRSLWRIEFCGSCQNSLWLCCKCTPPFGHSLDRYDNKCSARPFWEYYLCRSNREEERKGGYWWLDRCISWWKHISKKNKPGARTL